MLMVVTPCPVCQRSAECIANLDMRRVVDYIRNLKEDISKQVNRQVFDGSLWGVGKRAVKKAVVQNFAKTARVWRQLVDEWGHLTARGLFARPRNMNYAVHGHVGSLKVLQIHGQHMELDERQE